VKAKGKRVTPNAYTEERTDRGLPAAIPGADGED